MIKANWKLNYLMISVTVAGIAIATLVMILYNPQPKNSAIEMLNIALEDKRAADAKMLNAKLDSIRIDNRLQMEASQDRENTFIEQLNQNTEALKQNRNEKSLDYNRYNSVELQRAIADAARYYRSRQ